MYKLIAAGIGVAILALAALGCGGSGEDTASAEVTKAQFTKQGNAICAKASKTVQEESARRGSKASNAGFELIVKKVLGPVLQQEANELEGLEPPTGDEAKLDRMIQNLSKGAAGLEAEGLKTSAGVPFEQFQKEAVAYGLAACNI